MFAALLDTCVLWPSLQRDFLLSMAAEGLYRPLWSDAILEELHRHEQLKRIERGMNDEAAQTAADHLMHQMRTYFTDAIVTNWEPLDGSFDLPDPDDEHVLAAAVVGGAGAIVTDNLRHFPPDRLPSQVQVVSGGEFAADTATVDPARAARAICQIAQRHHDPPETASEIVNKLVERYGMHDLTDAVVPLLDIPRRG